MIASRHCFDRVHRLFLSAVVAVFTLLQVLVPLLHTHVSPSGASAQAGIHLPVTLVHEGHGHGNASLSNAVALDEANAITAPTEHRRDEIPAGERAAHTVSLLPTGSPPTGLQAAQQAAIRAVPTHGYLPHPPAQAPPASA